MTRTEFIIQSENAIRQLLKKYLPAGVIVYLYGSRACNTNRWNSDYDLWVDGDLSPATLSKILDDLDESFVPFKVDIVSTNQLQGRFGEQVTFMKG